jgi:hypothetical protein
MLSTCLFWVSDIPAKHADDFVKTVRTKTSQEVSLFRNFICKGLWHTPQRSSANSIPCYNVTAVEEPGKECNGNILLNQPKNALYKGKE